MDIALAPSTSTPWRAPGKQRRPVPPALRKLVDGTYGTTEVVTIDDIHTDADREEAREVVSLARTYAESLGRRLRIQPYVWDRNPSSDQALAVTRVMFKMVDKETR